MLYGKISKGIQREAQDFAKISHSRACFTLQVFSVFFFGGGVIFLWFRNADFEFVIITLVDHRNDQIEFKVAIQRHKGGPTIFLKKTSLKNVA